MPRGGCSLGSKVGWGVPGVRVHPEVPPRGGGAQGPGGSNRPFAVDLRDLKGDDMWKKKRKRVETERKKERMERDRRKNEGRERRWKVGGSVGEGKRGRGDREAGRGRGWRERGWGGRG